MLSASTKLYRYNKRIWFLTSRSNHSEKKTDIREIAVKNENAKEKFTKLSTNVILKYNSIIGFDEIDTAYKKVTALQEDLAKIQNERTQLQLQINHKIKDLSQTQTELQEHRRGDAKYIELMKRGKFNCTLSFSTQLKMFNFL